MNKIESKLKKIRVRGTGTYDPADNSFGFVAFNEGSPSQLDVKTCRGGKTFLTTSESNPQKVVHLSCAAKSPDPWTEYTDKLRLLGIKPLQEQPLPQKQRLVSEGGMEVYLDAKNGQMLYQGRIDLMQSLNWQSEVMRQLQIIVRTLPVHKKFTEIINKIRKGGKS